MPLELGLFLAAKKFGSRAQKLKKCIVFESNPYDYQKFMSDIAGQDIHSHRKSEKTLILELSGWLRRETHDNSVPGGSALHREYSKFKKELPKLCKAAGLKPREMTFFDFRRFAEKWIVS